ncbi:ABC transporter permease [Microbacterium sp. 179-B 1A2 NHS]|uniref:ABC transporter permease n=1 Tax=Microbacterium sp. 179-B 1A2 NHS TaxID=3142383 RepID=UPI0039A18EDA
MSLVRVTQSELTKLFSTSIWWILALVLVVYAGGNAAILAWVFGASSAGSLPGGSAPDIPAETIPPVIYSTASAVGYVFPLLIGALMVTSDFRHQTLTPTFLATPRRARALGGKVIAGAGIGIVYAVVGLAATVAPGAAIFVTQDVPTALDDSDTWALLGRVVIAYVLWVLVGIGAGTLLRNQVAAIVVVVGFTQLVEPVVRTVGAFLDGVRDATAFLPGAASDGLVGASIYSTFAPPAAGGVDLAWWGNGLVLLGYAVVLMVVGYVASWRRDVA